MKDFTRPVMIITKIIEVCHWVAAALLTGALVTSLVLPDFLNRFVDMNSLYENPTVSIYGFETSVLCNDGTLHKGAFALFAVGGILIFIAMAMIYRNLYQVVRNAKNSTPFQKDNVRLLKEIGIFAIAIPVVGLLFSTMIRLTCGVDNVELSVDLNGFLMGFLALCLTQYFAYGVQLEEDVEGLV